MSQPKIAALKTHQKSLKSNIETKKKQLEEIRVALEKDKKNENLISLKNTQEKSIKEMEKYLKKVGEELAKTEIPSSETTPPVK